MKKVFGPVPKSLENTSQDITKTIVETSNEHNKALENLNSKLLDKMNGRGVLASYLMSPLSKITLPEKICQFKLVKESNSNRVNDLKMNKTIPIIPYNNLLTLRDTGKKLELKGDLLKMITNNNYNVNHASSLDKKLRYEFAKEMNFDVQAPGDKSTRDRTPIKLLKLPGLVVSASGVWKQNFYRLILTNFVID